MNKLFEIKFGSHLYGTNTENSDLDLKSVYIPTDREIVLGTHKRTIMSVRPKREFERNNKDDVDVEILSLDRFVQLLLEGQTMALDMLFAPLDSYTSLTDRGHMIMSYLQINRREFLNKNINAFVGYAKQQAAKYGQKGFRIHALRVVLDHLKSCENKAQRLGESEALLTFAFCANEHIRIVECKGPNGKMEPHLEVCDKKFPFHAKVSYVQQQIQRMFDAYGHRALLAEKNEGVDWKALSHAVRVNSEAKEVLTSGWITFPRPDAQLLLCIKKGEVAYKAVAELIEQGLEDIKAASLVSNLRDEPNYEWAQDFIYEIYSDVVKQG